MWVVYHVLVKHGVRIAQDERRLLLEDLISLQVILVETFACGREEHRINLSLRLFVFDPDVLPVECI